MAKGHKDDIHRTPDVHHIQNPDVTHEESDVNVRGILIFTAGLLVVAIIVHILMLVMFNFMQERQKRLEPQPGPMAIRSGAEQIPPEPRLQAAPAYGVTLNSGDRIGLEKAVPDAERRELDLMWQDELKNGRKDPKTGQQISIPINEAMQKLLTEGNLPVRQTAGQNANAPAPVMTHGIELPTYSSSGRMTEKREQ